MDRFIENTAVYQLMFAVSLKSNMDRFIEADYNVIIGKRSNFKIQYG